MRRWTLITVVVLFVVIAVAAFAQIRLASRHQPAFPGPTSSPNALPT